MNSACCSVALGLLAALAAPAASAPKLTGIINLPDRQLAIIEFRDERGIERLPILRPGEHYEGCRLLAIDSAAGTATVELGQETPPITLRLGVEGNQPANGALNLKGASLRPVLDLYQALTGRTIVHSPILVHHSVDVQNAPGASVEECVQNLEKVLNRNQTLIRPRGKEFALAVPSKQEKIVNLIPEPPPFSATDSNQEIFPPGLLRFTDADVLQVLDVYSELAQRTILRPNVIPGSKITLKSQSALTRKQTIWLFDAALRLGGVTVVQSGDKFAFVFPSDRDKGAPVIDLTAVEAKIRKPSPPEDINIADGSVQQLLHIYSAVLGREPLPIPPNIPQVKFSLRTHSPLTVIERAFALEAVAALNHLAFDVVEPDRVAIRHSSAPTRTGN